MIQFFSFINFNRIVHKGRHSHQNLFWPITKFQRFMTTFDVNVQQREQELVSFCWGSKIL